ncbi:MAG: putative metalloprotease CJM1_0395 family protein [FCB group bacterium]|jgi:hypothetical protein
MPIFITAMDAVGVSSSIGKYTTAMHDTESDIPGVKSGTTDNTANQNQDAYIPGASNNEQDKSTKETQAYQKLGKNATNNTNKNTNVGGTKELSPEDKKVVQELEKVDQQVKAHEDAHKAAGGSLVSGAASYSYTTGPDGKQYATGGEVQIDVSPVDGNPKATIQKMEQVRRAALAPVDPSAQDISVASLASTIEAEARIEMMKSNVGTGTGTSSGTGTSNGITSKAINSYMNSQNQNTTGKNVDFFIPGSGSAELYGTLANT